MTYFELPVGSSTVCKDFASKTLFFFAFLQFPSRELEQTCHFRMEAPRPRHSENDNIANMLDQKVQELSTYMKNKKILRVRSSTTFAKKCCFSKRSQCRLLATLPSLFPTFWLPNPPSEGHRLATLEVHSGATLQQFC